MDFGAIVFSLLLDLVFTAFLYLLVPVIFCLNKKPLKKSTIKKIIIINAVCIWLAFQIINMALGVTETSAAVFLWSWVGYTIMKKCLAIDEDTSKKSRLKFEQPTVKNYEPHKKDTTTNKTTEKTESNDSCQ